jgi:hypothetical protein
MLPATSGSSAQPETVAEPADPAACSTFADREGPKEVTVRQPSDGLDDPPRC